MAANHWFAPDCFRSAQRDGKETADIKKALPGCHVEVKRRKKIAATHFMEQAMRDKVEEDFPLVLMREDRGDWLVMFRIEDSLNFVKGYLKNRYHWKSKGPSYLTSDEFHGLDE